MKTIELVKITKKASAFAALMSSEQKDALILSMADALEADMDAIIESNRSDLEKAKGTVSDVMLDRLFLDEKRIRAMASGMREIAKLKSTVARISAKLFAPTDLL